MSTSMNRRKTRRHRREGTRLETLEPRQLLSSVPVNFRSLWTIRGDTNSNATNDIISVVYNPGTRMIDVNVDGVVTSKRAARISSILILSGDGDDTITVDTGKTGIRVTIRAGDGNDTIHGGAEADTIDGGAGNDYIDGGGGNDRLNGGDGNDTVIGGLGKNTVTGGSGTDILYAVKGRDTIGKDRFDSFINSNKPALEQSILPNPGASTPPVIGSDTIRQRLIDEAVARYRNLLGTTFPAYYSWIQALAGSTNTTTLDGTSTDHSSTNNQVTGVEEGDIVQTDGNYLYTIKQNMLLVIDVRNPSAPQIISTTQFNGSPTGLYLAGNRLVVLVQEQMAAFRQQATSIWVFNVATPANPSLLEKTALDGTIASSRMIGDQLYLVMRNNLDLPGPQTTYVNPPSLNLDGTTSQDLFGGYYQYQTEDEYRTWLAAHINDYLPWYYTTLADGSAGPAGSPLDHIQYLPDNVSLTVTTSVFDFDLSDNSAGPASVAMAAGSPDTIYVSGSHLYALGNGTPFGDGITHILKFDLGKDDVHFDAAGDVSGNPLNSYSIDEYQGQVRLVTTSYDNWQETHSLYILRDEGDQLTVTGELDNIGDGEDLRSVLFMQDRAFVVTFRQVDPLFAIDLSNPGSPTMVGELVMPGFSTYLYPLDHDHLIGIGQGEGSQADNFHNVQVSLYNVADLSNPFIVDQKLYESPGGWGGTGSTAAYDPHAFAYFADSGVLAIPLNTWGDGDPTNSVAMLKVDPSTGFTDLGEVRHTTAVQRSVQIGDNLFSLADGDLKVVTLLQPSHVLAEILLPGTPPPDPSPIFIGPPIWMPPILIGNPILITGPITIIISPDNATISQTQDRHHRGKN